MIVKNLHGVEFNAQMFGIERKDDKSIVVYGIPTPYVKGDFEPVGSFLEIVDAMDYCDELNKKLYVGYIERSRVCNKEACLEHLKELTDLINELCV